MAHTGDQHSHGIRVPPTEQWTGGNIQQIIRTDTDDVQYTSWGSLGIGLIYYLLWNLQ